MKFKLVFNNEIHIVKAELKSHCQLTDLIQKRFFAIVPMNYYIEYFDDDGDQVSICNEDDFQVLLDDLKGKKSMKLYIQDPHNLIQIMPSKVKVCESKLVEPKEEIAHNEY